MEPNYFLTRFMTMIHILCQYYAEHSPLPYVYFTYKTFREVNLPLFSGYWLSYWHTSYSFWRSSSCQCVVKRTFTDVSEDCSVFTFRISCSLTLALKMKALLTFETSRITHWRTKRHIPEERLKPLKLLVSFQPFQGLRGPYCPRLIKDIGPA